MGVADLSIWLCFIAGLAAFLSPCSLPLYPSLVAYITGVPYKNRTEKTRRSPYSSTIHTFFFMGGFSVIYYSIGMSASLLGDFFYTYNDIIRRLGGLVIVLLGLIMMGVLQPQILMKDTRFSFKSKPPGYIGSFLVGLVFAAGWSPCIGVVFATVATLGVIQPDKAFLYITVYNIGFSLPFLLTSLIIPKLKWILKYSLIIAKVGGTVMIIMGLLLFFNRVTIIIVYLNRFFSDIIGTDLLKI